MILDNNLANIGVDTIQGYPSARVVNITGELDESNLPDFERATDPLIQDTSIAFLFFNLEKLEFISSKVIGYFAHIYTTLNHDQRLFVMAGLNQTVQDIFALVGLDQVIPHYPNLQEALRATLMSSNSPQ